MKYNITFRLLHFLNLSVYGILDLNKKFVNVCLLKLKDVFFLVLYLACNSNQFECLQLLLLQPAINVDIVDTQGRTPLFIACSLKDSRFTEELLNAGANPDHQDKEGKT